MQVQRNYENIEDIIRMCRLRIRVPDQWWGDYLAMMGAARIGEREVLALGAEIGWDALETFVREWFDYGERRMDQAIRAIPSERRSMRASTTRSPVRRKRASLSAAWSLSTVTKDGWRSICAIIPIACLAG